jgi:hypothetical protein
MADTDPPGHVRLQAKRARATPSSSPPAAGEGGTPEARPKGSRTGGEIVVKVR